MALFRYRAFTGAGDLSEGEIEAASFDEAEETLFARGLTPFETKEVERRESNAFARFSGKRAPSLAELSSFTREFATLEQADVPIDQALRMLSAQNVSPVLRELSDALLRRIVDGASLSDALARQPVVFSPEYVNIVRAGETTGDVASALVQLADMLERRLELKGRMQSALVYPALLIALAIVSTGIVLGVLVPNVAPIFADSGAAMPAGLQFIIDLEASWPLLLGFIIALVASALGVRAYAARRPDVKASIDRVILRLPFAGRLKAQHETARFARTLGVMTRAGVPLIPGLESARAAVENLYLGRQLDAAIEAVRGGASLSSSLAKIDGLPPVAAQIVSVGEEAGKLDEMLLRLAEMFERQTQRAIERAMGLLTPALTVAIAGVVGGLIMTVMNAVLSVNELATR